MGRHLDPAVIKEIRRLWRKGHFKGQICKELGVSKTAVNNHIRDIDEE